MTSTYDKKTDVWTTTNGVITVSGPTKSGCEERFLTLLSRYRSAQSLREPRVEDQVC
jgi:hypothetical protein